MPRRYSMGTLVTRCQQRADLEGDEHISTAEWKALISEKWGELYALVAGTGLRYFETESTITADGSASYDEPDDHLATIGVDFVIDSAGRRRQLYEVQVLERSAYAGRTGEAFAFSHIDDQIYLHPNPTSGTYKLLYIPQPPDLSSFADGDEVDVVTPDGESFLIWSVAAMALPKSESDPSAAIGNAESARVRLVEWAAMRSFTQPRRRVAQDFDLYSDADEGDWRWG